MAKKIAGVPGVDPTFPRVPIELGGETYFLAFTFKALAFAASELRKKGVEVNLLRSLDLSVIDADRLGPLLFAAMITHQPEIQAETVEGLLTLTNFGRVFGALVKAYTDSVAEPSTDKSETTSPKAHQE